jgi:hypothetical protein
MTVTEQCQFKFRRRRGVLRLPTRSLTRRRGGSARGTKALGVATQGHGRKLNQRPLDSESALRLVTRMFRAASAASAAEAAWFANHHHDCFREQRPCFRRRPGLADHSGEAVHIPRP